MGRIQIYDEYTKVFSYRVPMSKAKVFDDENKIKLSRWKLKALKKRQKGMQFSETKNPQTD